jgi:hypothetical protein
VEPLHLAWLASFAVVCVANAALSRPQAALIPAAVLGFTVPFAVLLSLGHRLQPVSICGIAVGALVSALVLFAARTMIRGRGKREP